MTISATTNSESSKPVWLRVNEAVRLFGVSRSLLYEYISEGKIKSRVLKSRRDSVRGIRLLSFDSLNEMICACDGSQAASLEQTKAT